MEALISLLQTMVEAGAITDTGLSLLILVALFVLHKYVWKPTLEKIKSIPSKKDIEQMLVEKNKQDDLRFEEILKRVNNLIDNIEMMDEFLKYNERDVNVLKKDIEQIKQILNQFQGHMLYKNSSRGDFGNRELK